MSLAPAKREKRSRPVRQETVYESVLYQIKTFFRDHHYRPGARLPGERALAEQLGVSRPALREAMRTLGALGVVEARQGSGTHLSLSSAGMLKTSFEFLMLFEQPSIYELYETRELMEVHLAGRAAERREEEDLAQIKSALEAMKEGIATPARMTDPNVRFHQAVAAAAHNPVMERFMDCLCDGIKICIEATRPPLFDAAGSYERHFAIFDAIRRQNPADARRAMTLHMGAALEALRQSEREYPLYEPEGRYNAP